ncbi:hypothetical protein B566_EDAN002585 [Ephemera danica]|nr:hypothetical protein B566_EDAN002585 [Ephemera danica]
MLQWGGSVVYKLREVVTDSRVPQQVEMGAVTNLLVLLCAASCTTAWERLPNIPANRRAEYYLLHNDGGYKYGYDTGSGSSHSAMADANNEVRGSYAYQSPEGPVSLVYTAGRGGFVPDTGSAVQSQSHQVVSAVRSQTPFVTSPAVHSTRTEQQSSSADYDENADASYNFNFDTDEYKRQEASDAKGNIRGRYSYNTKEGNRVAVEYKAGSGTGFVIEKQEGLDAPAAAAAAHASPARSQYQFSAPSPVNIPAPKPYSGPLANTVASGPLQDGSYSFSYQSSDHDRQESGDASGLVRGRYSFVADDGVRRTVDYHAGAQSGYVPTGDGIAPVPAVPAVQAYTARPAIVAPKSGYQYQAPAQGAPASQGDETPGDASYSFAYEADDHARKESSDPSGNVEGEYSYTAPDGQNRKIKYTAGAEKGFVVQEEQSAVSNYAAKSAAPKPAPYVPQPAPYAPQPAAYVPQPAVYSAPASASHSAFAAQHAAMTKSVVESLGNTDASYSFSYQTNDQSHNANADKSGNVRGSYSFVADDGVNRQVDYEAGSATGFIARGAHLPVAPVVPIQNTYTASQTYSSKPAQSYVPAPQIKSYIPPIATPAYIAPVVKSSAVPTDGSYSFSYNAGDSARQENADASGYVRGQYSFIADDGVSRSVQYEAGANKGFVAQGSHLPAAPEHASAVSISRASVTPQAVSSYNAAASAKEEKGHSAYSYNYQTDTSSKTESSDAQGNVVGSFTFVGGDGQSRTLNYAAGPESGFQASGAHLPVAPVVQANSAFATQSYAIPVIQSTPVIAAKTTSTAHGSGSWTKAARPLANTVASGPLQDGSYSFSYQSSDHDRQESGDASGLVRGRYSFVADDGVRRTVDYHAGAQSGYVPTGDGIAPVPAVPAVQAYTARPAIVAPKSGYQYQAPAQGAPASQGDETPGDASYSFAYEADDHARKESSDPSGNVEGEYSYTAPDGQNRKIKYTAGAEKGFVVQEEQSAVSNYAAKSAAPKPAPYVPQPAPYAPQPAAYVPQPAVYSAPASASHSAFAAQHAAMTKSVVESLGNTDASYSFSYQTNDQSHNANADKSGNVRGSYSFVADDGVNRQVDYEAGSATGFIARGAHLPVAPVVPIQNTYTASQTYSSKPAQSYVPAPQIKSYIPPIATPAYIAPVVKSSAVPTDGSYSFSYNAGDSARQENADASGYVRGQYSFIADDGVSRSVQYEAGANKGFVAQGSHLPAAPEHASAVSISRASVTPQAVSSYNAAASAKEEKGHSAYSYNYQTDTSSKTESSDAQGNVVGSFTFVGGDGQSRTLNYAAGPESGFQASGAHLPVAPVVQANSAFATQSYAIPVIQSTPVIAAKTTSTAHGSGSWTKAASWTAPAANFVLHKYLPPESAQKYGYVFDTQA